MFLADPPSDPASVRLFGFAFRAENFNPCPTLPCWSFWEFLCSSISLVGVGQVYTTLLCLAVKHIFIKRRKKMMLTGSVIEPCWQRCAARMVLLRHGRQYSLTQRSHHDDRSALPILVHACVFVENAALAPSAVKDSFNTFLEQSLTKTSYP